MREFLSNAWAPDGSLFVAFTDATDQDDEGKGRITVTKVRVDSGAGDEPSSAGGRGP